VQLLVAPRPRDWREVATFLAPVGRSDSIAFTPTAAQGMKQNRVGVEVGSRHQNSYRISESAAPIHEIVFRPSLPR
jgi:hypothetical protein